MDIEKSKELLEEYRDDKLFGVAGREALGVVLSELEKKDKRLNRQFKLLQKRDKEIEQLKSMELKAKHGIVSITLEGLINLENEIKKKDKIIDLMAEEIEFRTGSCPYDVYDYDLDCEKRCKHDIETECWIKYFTKKAEGK